MAEITLQKIDNVNMRVDAEEGIIYELFDKFSFYAPNYRYMPTFKNGMWDGKIRMINLMTKRMYLGLWNEVNKYAKKREYSIETNGIGSYEKLLDDESIKAFCEKIKLPFEPRDFQHAGFKHGVNGKRVVFESPTASGKSFIIYLISRYLNEVHKKKVLVIVPTIALTEQMKNDFIEYNNHKDDLEIHCISGGVDKNTEADYTMSTWQSIANMKPKQLKSWLDKFDVIIGDEAHTFAAKSLIKIMEAASAEYRIGFTGTVHDEDSSKFTLMGLFGPVIKLTTTKKLIEKGQISDLEIRCLNLVYPQEQKKLVSKNKDYQKEKKFILDHANRIDYLADLAVSCDRNVLLLFQIIKHGQELEKAIAKRTDRKIFFIYGGTEAEIRDKFRAIVEKEKDAIIIASFGVLSTGVNIKNIHYIILGSPYKSKIKILQSIGRGLRLHGDKVKLVVFDIVDDLRFGRKTNFVFKNFLERLEIYKKQEFKFKITNVNL